MNKSWPKQFTCAWKHLLKISICSQPKQDKFKKSHRENNSTGKEKKRSTYEERIQWNGVVRDSRVWMLEWQLSALRLNTKSTKPDIYTLSNELLWKMEVKAQCLQLRQRCNNTQSIDLHYKMRQRNLLRVRENDVIRKHVSQDRNIKL